jgi:hypothetical protein
MKKILKCLIIIFILLPVGVYASVKTQLLPFEFGAWGNTHGGEIDPTLNYGIEFHSGTFYQYWQADKTFYGGKGYQEEGSYTSSNDSIFITITKSSLPIASERIGKKIITKWISIYNNKEIMFTNAKDLTAGWADEDSISMVYQVVSVKKTTWAEIKKLFITR